VTVTEWIAAVGGYVGPFVGVLGALWLYLKRSRDEERRREVEQRAALLRELRAEVAANQRIIERSLASIEELLQEGGASEDANDPIYDERFYLAPLFADSWNALTRTNAHRVLQPARLDQLFGYYTAVARVNWLLGRVQSFKFRRPILREIRRTLDEVRNEVGDALELSGLESELVSEAQRGSTRG
jgi:hypothetical protein